MKSRIFLFLATLLAAQGALAHDDATLDATAAPHGGQLRMAGPYHYELVLTPSMVLVYVTDHGGNKLPASGASGSATVKATGTAVNVPLKSAADNLLIGYGKFDSQTDTKVIVSVSFPGKPAEIAQFAPWQKASKTMVHSGHSGH
jgi:hypothetical protein